MKRLVLNVVVMSVTFALGALCGRVVSKALKENVSVEPAGVVTKLEAAPEATPEVTPVSEPIAGPTPHLILDYNPKKFALSGYFEVLSPKPKEFKDFSFDLTLFEGEAGRPSASISIISTSGDIYDYHLPVFVFVTERRLFFVTLPGPQSAEEYRFDGEFLRTDFDAVVEKNQAVVRGKLTKMKNGRKIAERVVSFRMYEFHGC